MGKKKKQEDPVGPFVLIQRMAEKRRAKAHEDWLTAMTPVQRAEYRGATMAAGQVYRCLGHHAEQFGDDELLTRIQQRLHDSKTFSPDEPAPRPFGGEWYALHNLKIHYRKAFHYICNLNPRPQLAGAELQLSLDINSPRYQFQLYKDFRDYHFQFVFGVGLLSDMHFSAEQDEYIYQHPTLQGRFFGCESKILPVYEPTSIDLRLQLPLPDGIPPGLKLLTTVGLWFWWSPTDGPARTHTGMEMEFI